MTNAMKFGSETIASAETRCAIFLIALSLRRFLSRSLRKSSWTARVYPRRGCFRSPVIITTLHRARGDIPFGLAFFRDGSGDWKGAPSGRESDGEIVSQTKRDEIKRRTDGAGSSPSIIRLRARAWPENIQPL